LRSLRAVGFDGPVIALTGLASGADRQRALQAGFDAYLTKPLEPPEVVVAIERVREARRMPRQERA
jgi:CheY-like chemotaxis protein